MNIFEIQQELLEVFNIIEENDGELTPELEEKLAISQDNFVEKCKSYASVIKQINADLEAIKDEKDRLKKYEDSKKRTKERLSGILSDAITRFGDTTRTGGKFVDYGTGKISVRNTTSCETNEFYGKEIIDSLWRKFTFAKSINSIDDVDRLNSDEINTYIEDYNSELNQSLVKDGLEPITESVKVSQSDIDALDMTVSFDMNVTNVFCDEGRNILKLLAQYPQAISIKPKFDKTYLKVSMAEGVEYNIAKLKQNQSITIK